MGTMRKKSLRHLAEALFSYVAPLEQKPRSMGVTGIMVDATVGVEQ